MSEMVLHLPARVGRSEDNDLILAMDRTVARHHARLELNGSDLMVVDLDTATGTRVNGTRVERMAVRPHDIVQIGSSTLQFELLAAN